jgi:DNA-binding NarL/FixJ family response regulator
MVMTPGRLMRESAAERKNETSRVADVRLLVVDDHQAFRAVLREVVAATPGFTVVAEATCGEEAVLTVDALSPELVLMDVRMPGIGGCETTKIVVDRHPDVVVWLVTAEPTSVLRGLAVACGAAGVLDKRDLRPRVLRDHRKARGRPDGRPY